MTSNNLAIWDRLGRTDPSHTKGFSRAGGFKGTAIKPIYTEHKMTEVFGPAGKGWGMGEPTFQVVPGNDGQVAVFCTVSLWWCEPVAANGVALLPINPRTVYGVGGDMVVVKQSSGLRTDDEAFKKAFTDAVGNAMKHLGMSADVHMGRFDDSKYVSEVRAELAEQSAAPTTAPARISSYLAKKVFKTDVLLEEIDTAKSDKRCDEIQATVENELSFLPANWTAAFIERLDARRAELTKAITNAVAANDSLDRQFAETVGK